ncbi:cyclin-dependent kinase 5 homolog [Coccinella septempunctata]|uniref:cyclin-dependent kinase 5 homolog n=1 Tax=Coccinella septempunctata TaxID=41139 RepID=UPI001D05F796|nr:cyclin-dependent kinase 5 homolog [Coccinella septempunctata]
MGPPSPDLLHTPQTLAEKLREPKRWQYSSYQDCATVQDAVANETVAVKRTLLDQQAIHEVDMLRLLEHPNILPLHEAIIETDHLFMVMPLCDEDLNAFLRREGPRSQPSRFFWVMRQLAAALTECHRQRILG